MNNLAEEQEVISDENMQELPKKEETNEDDFEVEIVDDTPEEDRVAKRKEEPEPEEDSEEEIKNYGDNVQKRISKLKYDYHEERRAKEEAKRLSEEALKYAENLKKDNENLRKTLADGESMLIDQAKGRVGAELEKAKKDYKEAYESGDPDKLLEAQEKMSKLHNEQFRVDEYQPQPQQPQVDKEPKPQKPVLSERDLDWQKNNTWFEKDTVMRGTAMGIHEQLKQKGIVPGSEQYYKEIDEGMRNIFPEKFEVQQEAPERQNGNVVAPVERHGKKSRTVRLTRTQVALAKRLGLSNEQYAAQLMKDQSNG
jgi:hypothetical protein|tara:strand:- start:338 stop:1270 length:933 start_codon:yes stop_codon:yes gene_type:complete